MLNLMKKDDLSHYRNFRS